MSIRIHSSGNALTEREPRTAPQSAISRRRPGTARWSASPKELPTTIADRRLARTLRGEGAFRRFKDELYDEYPDLVSAWQTFRDDRAKRRAVEWLLH